MANERMLMHQMEVKGKRLAYGLNKFIEAYQLDPKSMDVDLLYVYALACIGDERCKKFAVKCPECARVYEDLKQQKLVKDTTADKMIADSMKNIIGVNACIEVKEVTPPKDQKSLVTSSDFKVTYDNNEKRVTAYNGSEAYRGAYDRMMEHFQVNKKFPTEFIMDDGTVWIRTQIDEKGGKIYVVTYSVGF